MDQPFQVYVMATSVSKIDNTSHKIFPNPTSSIINIEASKPIEKIELYSLTGELILSSKEVSLDLLGLTSSTYTLQIYYKDGDRGSELIILQD